MSPVLTTRIGMYINSAAFVGSIATSIYISFLSILAGVLFVLSQTTAKSYRPHFAKMSAKNLSTASFALALVSSSFGSNTNGLASTSNRSLK